jgi:transcriptional regulator with XRE-family HTH domain
MANELSRGAVTLRQILVNRRLKQTEMALEVGCDDGRLSKILRGLKLPDLDLAVRIRDRYGIDPGHWKEPPEATPSPETPTGTGGD